MDNLQVGGYALATGLAMQYSQKAAARKTAPK